MSSLISDVELTLTIYFAQLLKIRRHTARSRENGFTQAMRGGLTLSHTNLLINTFVFKLLTSILNLQRKPGPQNPDTVQVSEEEIPFLYQMKLNSSDPVSHKTMTPSSFHLSFGFFSPILFVLEAFPHHYHCLSSILFQPGPGNECGYSICHVLLEV